MPIDMRRPLLAAIQAALDEVQAEPPKKRHGVGAGRALLLGAGLYTAGRVVTKGHVKGMLEAIQQRLPEQDDTGDHGDEAEDEFDEEEPQDEFDEEEPQAAAEEDAPADEAEDEEPVDEDEPVDDADEDVDKDEPADDADGDEPAGEADEDEAPAPARKRGRSTARSRR